MPIPELSLSPSNRSSKSHFHHDNLRLNYHILQEKVRKHIYENRLTEQRNSRRESEREDEGGPLEKYRKLFEHWSEGKGKKNVKIIGKYKFEKNSQKKHYFKKN